MNMNGLLVVAFLAPIVSTLTIVFWGVRKHYFFIYVTASLIAGVAYCLMPLLRAGNIREFSSIRQLVVLCAVMLLATFLSTVFSRKGKLFSNRRKRG